MNFYGININGDIHYMYFPVLWEKGVIAATSLRLGGVSPAPYNSLNTGLHTKDSYENVIKNRERFFKALRINYKNIVTLKQIHSDRVVVVKKEDKGKGAIKFADSLAEADGMITQDKRVPMVVFTADCIPIFFFEKRERIVGIAHSGWKGSLKNIAGEVVNMIIKNGGKYRNIIAVLGPAIANCCYSVKEDVYSLFEDRFINKRDGSYFLDLYKVNFENLKRAGIEETNIYSSNFCTSCNNNLCFSYRREGETGRMASVIMLCQ